MAVKLVPEGDRTVTPYPAVDGAALAIEFHVKAFRAKERRAHSGAGRQDRPPRARVSLAWRCS